MAQVTLSNIESPRRRSGLLRDQVQLVKRKDSDRYEIAPIQDPLSFEKGFFIVIRACQLLAQKNDGIILVGVAGPSGAGKTVFTEKLLHFLPSIAVITMDNYNDSSRIIDGNFDDPRLTDYDTLLENIRGLKEGKPVQVPIYDFKSSSRIGYRTIEVPSSRVVIIEGIYALSERLRPLLDLRVSVTGGVHFDLVKRVLRDIQRAGQEPEEIIHQISETVYPMYKAFIEPDLQTAHIKIINKFNPFSGFQNPTYILKSTRAITVEQIKAVLSEEHVESTEETYDIYLLPPGEDPEACQSYLRMRNRDGKYNLMFEEWVTDSPFIISPRITFEVSVRLLGGLMALGYTIASILKRSSHVFFDDRVCVKTDWLEQLNRKYVQALPADLKTKLSIDDDLVSSPKEALSRASADRRMKYLNRGNLTLVFHPARQESVQVDKACFAHWIMYFSNLRGIITQLSEQISTLNERMDEFTSRIEELNSKYSIRKVSASQQNLALQAETSNGGAPTSLFMAGLNNGTLPGSMLPHSASSSQLAKESPLMEEVLLIARGQRQVMHQLDNLSNLLHEYQRERSREGRTDATSRTREVESVGVALILTLAIVALASFCSGLFHPKNDFPATNPHLTALEYVYICSLLAAVMITAPDLS
ncbi:phosphoribulokinase [Actinidia rufa]|uniref:Phosphoribulokinase n=1 Tax=Actinidia rufa TaxID=165716 RepID=A0A7J0H0X9_9ERIC|nr:phosphoribulokinase [Actinidia rufa]